LSASVSSRELFDPPQFGNRDLEVGQELQQHRLELLVGLVDLVDQQDDRSLRRDRGKQRPREQELLAEDVVLHLGPAGAVGLRLDPQQLLAVVPLIHRLGFVEPLVALQAHQLAPQTGRHRLRQLGLANAGGAFDEHRLVQPRGEIGDQRRRSPRQIASRAQAVGEGFHRFGQRVHCGQS
jgi:hypothetical protein